MLKLVKILYKKDPVLAAKVAKVLDCRVVAKDARLLERTLKEVKSILTKLPSLKTKLETFKREGELPSVVKAVNTIKKLDTVLEDLTDEIEASLGE